MGVTRTKGSVTILLVAPKTPLPAGPGYFVPSSDFLSPFFLRAVLSRSPKMPNLGSSFGAGLNSSFFSRARCCSRLSSSFSLTAARASWTDSSSTIFSSMTRRSLFFWRGPFSPSDLGFFLLKGFSFLAPVGAGGAGRLSGVYGAAVKGSASRSSSATASRAASSGV
jgi:hypothetical protein